MLTKIAQILKTVNACLVIVAPAKIQSIPADDAQIADFDLVRNRFRRQCSLAGPFVDALGARTSTTQVCRLIVADVPVGPGDSQQRIALLRDLTWLDRLASLGYLNHRRSAV